LRGAVKVHAAREELLVGFFHVFAQEGEVGEGADVAFVFLRREKDDAGFRAGNAQLDPALLAEGLVSEDVEAELFGVEGESAILVADGDAPELYASDHFVSILIRGISMNDYANRGDSQTD
jgi:hypothetical protein